MINRRKMRPVLAALAVVVYCGALRAEDDVGEGVSEVVAFDTRGMRTGGVGGAVLHEGGVMSESATWTSDSVHVVYGWLTVPFGMALTVSPGTTVKFVGGGILAEGLLVASGATFTDWADDSVVGDTDGKGWGQPSPSYVIEGNVTVDADTRFYCRNRGFGFALKGETDAFRFDTRGLDGELPSNVVAHWGGELDKSETWSAGAPHVVYGTMTVPTGVVLSVENGAVVKFVGGGLSALGSALFNGAHVSDWADDSIGGDSDGKGWSQPYPSYFLDGNVDVDAQTVLRCRDRHFGFAQEGTTGVLAFDTRGLNTDSFAGMCVHQGGTLETDETWEAGVVHVVYGTLVVPTNVTLTIASGADVRFVGGGIASDGLCVAKGVSFSDFGRDQPYVSYSLDGNFEMDETTVAICRKDGIGVCSAPGSSGVFVLTTVEPPIRFANTPQEVTFSTVWDDSSAVEVTETRPDGSVVTLTNGVAEAKGVFLWAARGEPGLYTLRHVTDTNVLSAAFYLLDDVTEHSGAVSNEIWTADTVHVVNGKVEVADGVTLTIEPGTVVKFTSGSSLNIAPGGICVAKGVTFTHFNDDTVGGDTLGDGVTEVPEDEYEISGWLTFDEETTCLHYPGQPVWIVVENVSTRQRYPWNGLVDIDCEVRCSMSDADICMSFSAKDEVSNQTLAVQTVRHESDPEGIKPLTIKAGRHRFVWDAGQDVPEAVSAAVTISVRARLSDK